MLEIPITSGIATMTPVARSVPPAYCSLSYYYVIYVILVYLASLSVCQCIVLTDLHNS